MGIRYTLCEHLQPFLPFPKSIMQNSLHSYDILMIKIKADPSQACFCWAQLFIFLSHFSLM